MTADAFPASAVASLNALQGAFPARRKLELERFARARPSPADAVSMYTEYTQWRSDGGRPEVLAKDYASMPPFIFSGIRSQGRANDGTAIVFAELARLDMNLQSAETYVKALCHLMDEAVPPSEDGQVTLVIDARQVQGAANQNAMLLMPFIKECIKVVPSMYPERLRRAIVYPVPWMATMIVSMVKKMLDPKTRGKLMIMSGDDKATSPCPAGELLEFLTIDSIPRHAWHRHAALDPGKVEKALLAASCGDQQEDEDDDFYSASEGEEDNSAILVRTTARKSSKTKPSIPVSIRLKDLAAGQVDEEDLERGPLMVGKEERAFLLELLAEAKERQPPRCCWPKWCKLCGHRPRFKQ